MTASPLVETGDDAHDDRDSARSRTCRSTGAASRTSSRSPPRCRSTLAQPALVRRSARHLLEHQRGRCGLQPAVLRRHPGRRAREHGVHPSAGSGAGIPGGRGGILGGVRTVHRRPGQRDHQVGQQREPRQRLLREPAPRPRGKERLRPGGGADAAAVRRLVRRPDRHRASSTSAPSSRSASGTPDGCSSTRWASRRRRHPGRA